MLLKVEFIATRTKNLRKPTLRLVSLVFITVMVVLTPGVGVVFPLISYFRYFSDTENSCVDSTL